MQDTIAVTLFSAVMLDSLPPSLVARLEPIYESEEDSPPPAKCSKRTWQNQIMALFADYSSSMAQRLWMEMMGSSGCVH